MNIIPVNNETLDLIEELNNGVRPEIEDHSTYFLWKGKDEIPAIVSYKDLGDTDRWKSIIIYADK